MKYIFVIGAPGSKWSSVSKNIYYSTDIDNSDSSEARAYHSANGTNPMHLGAYFDPGMEFGDFFDRINEYTKEECEAEFDKPFSGDGVRIIKSHVLADNIDFIKATWPDCPIVLVHRPDDACLGWWVKCGGFDITYPLYRPYYKDFSTMANIIARQNKNILGVLHKNVHTPIDNVELCGIIGITANHEYHQKYAQTDIIVFVI